MHKIQDNDKTQKELIKELTQLRRRIAELEAAERKRNQFEEALKESESRFRNIIENSKDGIIFFDRKTRKILFGNGAMAELLGCSKEDLVGRSIPSLHPSEEWASVEREFRKHVRGEILVSTGIPVQRDDGSVFYADISSSSTTLNGRTYFSAFFRDITERRRMQEALQESEEKYRLSFNNVTDVIYTLDSNLMVSNVSPSVERALGYKAEEVMNRPFSELNILASEFMEKATADVMRVFSGERIPASIYEFIAKDGTRKIGEVSGSPLYRNGKIIGLISVARDITERKRGEEALRESEERFRRLSAAAYEAIIIHEEGILLSGNDQYYEMFGYEPEELLGKQALPLTMAPEAIEATMREIATGGLGPYESIGLKKNGTKFPMEVRVREGEYEGRKVRVAAIRDITERKQAEKALRESEERFRLAFENANTGVCLVDLEGNLTRVNNKMCEIFGYSKEELEQMTVNDIAFPEDIDKSPEFIQKTLRGEIDRGSFEKRYVHKNGHVVTCEVSSSLVRDVQGTPLYFISHVNDITNRKQAEAQIERALRETRVRFEISQTLAGAQTEDEVLDVLIRHAGLYLQAFVVIFTFDKIGGEVAAIVRRQNPFESGLTTVVPIGGSLPLSRYTLFGRLSTDRPFVSGDARTDEQIEPAGREILGQTGAASIAMFPLTVGNEWMGLILTMAKPANYFDEEKQHLYQTLAEQGAVALRAVRLREQIRESQQRFQGLVETISDWIWEIDENGTYTYASPKIKDLLGYEPAEVLGKTPFDLMPPEEAERVKVIFSSLVAAGQPLVALENTNRHKDGRLVVFETSGVPLFDVGGYLRGYRGVDRDITERKKIEEALKEGQETFKAIIDTSQDWIWAIDSQGVHTYSNPAIEKILGYRLEEIVGRSSFDLIYEGDKKMVESILQECEKKRCGWNNLLLRWQHKDGTYRYLESNAVPILNSKGDLAGFQGVDRDITERKRAEKEIEWLANFPRLNPMPIVEVDQNGQLSYVNPASQRLFPDLEKMQGDHPFLTGINPYWGNLRKKREMYSIREVEVDGGWYSQVITLSDPEHLRIYAMDITKDKQAEKALHESEEKYRDLVENINDIIYAIDEKGIITYISPAIELLSGYALAEIIGRPFFDFVYEEDIPSMRDNFQQDISGKFEPHEYRTLNKTGELRWVRVSSRPFYMENRVTGLRGIMTDITERKQAEEAVKRSYEKLQETFHSTVTALASAVEMKDQYTAGHQPRVTKLACAVGEEMGLSSEQIEGIRMAASIHDIGKIMVPAEILNKPGPLTEIQYEMIKMHPRASYDILKGIKFPWPVAQIVLQHHERQDGSGYPQGLSGEEIMVEAKILAVANVVEAMNAHRPYRPAFDIKVALEEITKNRGILYDPEVADACLRLFTEKGFTLDPVPR